MTPGLATMPDREQAFLCNSFDGVMEKALPEVNGAKIYFPKSNRAIYYYPHKLRI